MKYVVYITLDQTVGFYSVYIRWNIPAVDWIWTNVHANAYLFSTKAAAERVATGTKGYVSPVENEEEFKNQEDTW